MSRSAPPSPAQSNADLVKEMGALAAKHQLVPFLGAGCSVPHLEFDWKKITTAIANEVSVPDGDCLVAAQAFVQNRGQAAFCEFLGKRLTVAKYDASVGATHLQILALGVGVIYTTNQDNVMEQCCREYGRRLKPIVNLEDLAEVLPGDPIYVKYHGDCAFPSSVVFTKADYDKRMNGRHFLNIRLESDLLAKRLLFVGFSFQDPNVRKTFEEIHSAFGNRLPPSYMIAWEGTASLRDLCGEFGIKLLVPSELHPEAGSLGEAFTKTMSDFVAETAKNKRAAELKDMFTPDVPPAIEVATKPDVDAVRAVISTGKVEDAVAAFRSRFDAATIPHELQAEIVTLFVDLAEKCDSDDVRGELSGAAFNLHLSDVEQILRVAGATYALANLREHKGMFRPHIRNLPEGYSLLAITAALELLHQWKRRLTDGMRGIVSPTIEYDDSDYTQFPPEVQAYVKHWMDAAWKDRAWGPHTTLEHPLERFERLKKLPGGGRSPFKRSYNSILEGMLGSLPKRFKKPHE